MSAVRGSSVSIIGPSAFLKELWRINQTVVEERLQEQAEAIGVSKDILLGNLAKAVSGFVAVARDWSAER